MMGIISHVSIGSSSDKMKEMVELYDGIMGKMGCKRQMAVDKNGDKIKDAQTALASDIVAVAYGKYYPEFWVSMPLDKKEASSGNGTHIAFNCSGASQVQEVYQEAMRLGAKDNGPPGPRAEYDSKYYAAYFIDPCGNKMEAMYYDLGLFGYCEIL